MELQQLFEAKLFTIIANLSFTTRTTFFLDCDYKQIIATEVRGPCILEMQYLLPEFNSLYGDFITSLELGKNDKCRIMYCCGIMALIFKYESKQRDTIHYSVGHRFTFKPLNLKTIKKENLYRQVKLIKSLGLLSTTEISELTEFSPTLISKIE